ncbi:MAG: LPXTG cell wall anchor domain-containing protein [Clostridia bacterium]|nr:LPXTG cell wall anchor domain-containing protein [Clostridia bacterium]
MMQVFSALGYAAARCTKISLPKTGSVSALTFALMAVVAAAGTMGKK